jgi:hypothetical protein
MKEILSYVMLDGKKEKEEKFFEGDISIDLENMTHIARCVANDTIFSVYYEEPEDALTIKSGFHNAEKKIDCDIFLTDDFYHKHIGKYMDADDLMLKLMMELEKNLDGVCWKTAAGHGCGGGCHG